MEALRVFMFTNRHLMEKKHRLGLVQIYTGGGKGKTTAALFQPRRRGYLGIARGRSFLL